VNLTDVELFVVPREVAKPSVDAMQAAGRNGAEAFVAWTGVFEDEGRAFRFRHAVVPRQSAHRTRHGLLVTIDGQALFELNRDCHQRGEILGAQIHSHPTDAYHSGADDELAFVRLPGGLSIVVPDFARGGLGRADGWSFHQLDEDGQWGGPRKGLRVEWA
jgi:proteasome lid subunit RPN8/RPN11